MPLNDYDPIFQSAAQEWNVDPLLLKAMAGQESGGNAGAVSKAGAQGLMQIIPPTQRDLGITDPTDPVQSIYGGAKYLSQALDAEKTPEDALRFYHGGPGWRDKYGPESMAYAPAVTSRYLALAKATAPQGATTVPTAATPSSADDPFTAALKAPAAAPATSANSAADPFTQALTANASDTPGAGSAGGSDATLPPNSGLGASILRGIHEATDVPANALASGADYVANKLGYHPDFARGAADTAAPFNQSYDADPNNQGWEPAAARMGGNALITIPASLSAGGLAKAALGRVAGTAAPLLTRLASPVVSGAAQGATASALTGGDVGPDAGLGAVLGGAGGILGAGVTKLMTTANPEVEAAVNKFGIPLRAGQVSDNKFIRYLDSQIGNMPGSGQEASNAAQRAAFNTAVSKTFGENASQITPAVMQQAKDRIGGVMDGIAGRTTIQADPQLLHDLGSIESNAQKMPSIIADIRPHITDILDTAAKNNGAIPGDAYQALTGKGSALSVAQQSGEGTVRNYANQIREALDDAFERSASPKDVKALSEARLQYKNMMTIAPLVNKGIPGDISPLLLQGAANRSFKSNAFRGAGDLGELGDLGQRYLRPPPDSGTATRTMINNTMYGDTKAAAAMLLGATAGRVAGSFMRANPLAGPSGIRGVIPSAVLLDNKLARRQPD